MTTTTPRKYFTLPLEPTVADAHGYVVADIRNTDPTAEIKQLIVCVPCRDKAVSEFGMTQLHETPVGPSDRCKACNGLLRGSTTETQIS